MVVQQSPFIKRLKCTRAYGGWSIFMEKCTPAVASSAIKVIAFFHLKNETVYCYIPDSSHGILNLMSS